MLWASIAILLSGTAFSAEISPATLAHLKLLQETQARMVQQNKTDSGAYQKVVDEIQRIKREYYPAGPSSTQSSARARQTNSNWENDKDDFVNMAEGFRQKRAKEEAENARAQKVYKDTYKYYPRREDLERVFSSYVDFGEKPISQGGLGYNYDEASDWALEILKKSPQESAAFRLRYSKFVLALQDLPRKKGLPKFERAYARKVALDLANSVPDEKVHEWIAKKEKEYASDGVAGIFNSCEAWFKKFKI